MFGEHGDLQSTWTNSSSSSCYNERRTGSFISQQVLEWKTCHILNIDATLRPWHVAIVQMLHSEALYCFLRTRHWRLCLSQNPHTAGIKLVHNGATQPHIFSIKHCVFTLSEQTKTFLVFLTVLHHRCWFQGHGVSPNLTLGEGLFFVFFSFFSLTTWVVK